jgi:hypothetical protein
VSYSYDENAGLVEKFIMMVENHCAMWGLPEQPWLIESLKLMGRIIDNPETPRWLRSDAEWSMWECLDRLIHDVDYLGDIGLVPTFPRRPVGDEKMLEVWAWLNQHAPEGLPSRAALKAELRRDATGLSVVK